MIIKLTAIMKALMEHQSLEWSYDHWVYYLNLTHVLPDADDEYFTASTSPLSGATTTGYTTST